MRLEAFFEKFELFADAQNAVAKMRELVLELAVRGQLVGQAIDDEPVADLLKRIYAEKRRRNVRTAQSDEDAEPAPSNEDFPIPPSWEWVGATIPTVMVSDQGKKVQTKDILASGKYPVIDQGKVFIRGYCDDSAKVISVTESIVLFGDHTRETKLIDFDFVVGADGVKLLQPICIDPKYYFLVLQWLPLESRGYGRHFKLLRAAKIPLPPLAEQKRIVAKMDELMVLCDRLEAQKQERDTRHAALARASLNRFAEAPTPANLDFLFHQSYPITPADLRKAILSLAVQGKLVPQEPSDEPPVMTFKRLAKAAVESSDEDFPEHWLRVPLGKLGEWRGGGTPSKSRPDFWKGNIPWVSPKDMKLLHIADAQDHISDAAVAGSSVRIIPDGSLLMVVRGMILARAFPVAITMRQVTINQDMKALLPVEPETTAFLLLTLRALEPKVLVAIERSTHGTCKLETDVLHAFTMPIPPLAEQRRIVAKVDQLMALVDRMEIQLAEAKDKGAALLDAIVAELSKAHVAV